MIIKLKTIMTICTTHYRDKASQRQMQDIRKIAFYKKKN